MKCVIHSMNSRRISLFESKQLRVGRKLEQKCWKQQFVKDLEKSATYYFVGSLPEHGENIDRTDGWGKVAGDGLDVMEQLPEVLNNRNPHDSNGD